MNWWNDFIDWSSSDHGWRVMSGAIIPFVAIVLAGVIAALIGRGATKRVVAMQERESRNAAVSGIVSAARKAASWGSLTHDERAYADHLAEDADIRLRLLPVAGAPVAANWAQHQIADIKKNSSTFSFQAEQSLSEFRDRMLEWQTRPSRARRLFRADLERWKFESPDAESDLVARQQQWNADQAEARPSAPTARSNAHASGTDAPGVGADAGVVAGSGESTRSALPESFGAATARFPIARPDHAPSTPAAGASTAAGYGSGSGSESDRDSTPEGEAPNTATELPKAPQSAAIPVGSTVAPVSARTDGDGAEEDDQQNAGELTHPKVDAATGAGTTSTTSIPTRIVDAPVEPADPNETNEAPYATPLSASELRRRAQEDDED
jgi:hypothetical protein